LRRGNRIAIALLCMSTSFMVSCGGTDPGARVTQSSDKRDNEKVLNLYIWADYLAPNTISSFDIDTSNYTEAMANGDICIGLGYSRDFLQARKRAEEA
jgi:spermidine/putrescine-binding protein